MLKIITLAIAIVVGLTKLLTYLLGDKRRLRKLKERLYVLERELDEALAKNDTVRISNISTELDRVRRQIRDINGK